MEVRMRTTMLALGALVSAALAAGPAAAHAGHALSSVHWHASDLFGLLAAALLGVWVWRSRR
jgi:hypothetical protein